MKSKHLLYSMLLLMALCSCSSNESDDLTGTTIETSTVAEKEVIKNLTAIKKQIQLLPLDLLPALVTAPSLANRVGGVLRKTLSTSEVREPNCDWVEPHISVCDLINGNEHIQDTIWHFDKKEGSPLTPQEFYNRMEGGEQMYRVLHVRKETSEWVSSYEFEFLDVIENKVFQETAVGKGSILIKENNTLWIEDSIRLYSTGTRSEYSYQEKQAILKWPNYDYSCLINDKSEQSNATTGIRSLNPIYEKKSELVGYLAFSFGGGVEVLDKNSDSIEDEKYD